MRIDEYTTDDNWKFRYAYEKIRAGLEEAINSLNEPSDADLSYFQPKRNWWNPLTWFRKKGNGVDPCIEIDGMYTDGTGQELTVHSELDCAGSPCPIHNPSNHHMKDWPTCWRGDKGIMERICPHGVGHPDPDDLRVKKSPHLGIHGCDGCCHNLAEPSHMVLQESELI